MPSRGIELVPSVCSRIGAVSHANQQPTGDGTMQIAIEVAVGQSFTSEKDPMVVASS